MPMISVLCCGLLALARAAPLTSEVTSRRRGTGSGSGISSDGASFSGQSFDYIIAGGGLTGLTVASRLTEDPSISVLVIENGQDNHQDPRVYDVRTYGEAFESDLDYNLTSTPVESQNGSRLSLVAGKTLAGSDSLNGASWTKGASSQYDILPTLTGDDSWGWGAFNEFMLKAEHFTPPSTELVESKGVEYDSAYHGEDGLLQVSFAQGIFGSIQQPALNASKLVWEGLSRTADVAAGVVNGATVIPNMVQPDVSQNRSSSFTAYAQNQVQERGNFQILTGHRVVEIVWKSGADVVAAGVRYQACSDCEIHFIGANSEVLLAAGSLQSPQILELSGVGDPEVLAAAGVPLKLEISGVGKNMQEQTKNSLYFTPKSTDFEGTGPSTAISFPNVHQILKDNATATYDYVIDSLPSYTLELETKGLIAAGSASAVATIMKAQVDNLFQDNAAAAEIFFTLNLGTGQVGIDLWNLIVLSRGTAHIQTNSSWDHPVVEPSYFGHPLDSMIQVAAAQQSREVYQTEPLASCIAHEDVPGASVSQDATSAEWESWVRSTFTSVWHYIATLSMMKEELGGVVSSRFQIYGIENVRVIDASVLPIQLSAHLSSSLYGIAEKAAATIKEDRQARS